MPLSDAEKSTSTLLTEIKNSLINPVYIAKANELLFREIKSGDSDDIVQGGTQLTRGGSRPNHLPLNP